MKPSAEADFSNKSLVQKLGLRQDMRAISINAPEDYKLWLGSGSAILKTRIRPPWDFVHLFTNDISELEDQLLRLRSLIKTDGMVWVSWYKKSSGKPTQINEDIIRDTCLPLGFVDVKVCPVSNDWSGLKLVIRLALR